MKNLLKTFFLVLMLAFCGSTVLAQGFPWQDFKPRTLKDLAAMEKDVEQRRETDGKPAVVFHGDMLLTRARVIYTGSTRPISDLKKQFLAQWTELYAGGNKEAYANLYETDLLFTENGVDYWLPVQKKVIPYFDKELKKGDAVDLYIVRAGGIYETKKEKDKWDWLLFVEEFQKPKEELKDSK